MGRSKKSFRPGMPYKNIQSNVKWSLFIIVLTFVISVIMSVTASTVMAKTHISVAFAVLLTVIVTGILFDMIGIAVTTATEVSFHSLSARRVSGAKESVRIIRLAPQVSSFCNDVIGDVAGIVSGASVSVIVVEMVNTFGLKSSALPSLVLTGLAAAMTVGGKSFAKGVAMLHANDIVFAVGKIFYFTKKILHIK